MGKPIVTATHDGFLHLATFLLSYLPSSDHFGVEESENVRRRKEFYRIRKDICSTFGLHLNRNYEFYYSDDDNRYYSYKPEEPQIACETASTETKSEDEAKK